MKLPNVIQTFFTSDKDHHELAHDYYLNATWVIGLVERFGGRAIGGRIRRSIEAKRKACIKKYGSEWERKEEILKKKMTMKQRIKIEGKNLNELFALPCVKGIMKTDDGSFRIRVKLATRSYVYAKPGWWIEEEDGKWRISPC